MPREYERLQEPSETRADVFLRDDRIAAVVPWSPGFIDAIKCIPGREWHDDVGCWSVPVHGGGAFDLKRALHESFDVVKWHESPLPEEAADFILAGLPDWTDVDELIELLIAEMPVRNRQRLADVLVFALHPDLDGALPDQEERS